MKFQLKSWTIPLALAAACVLSFALLIPSLGFYWDDWPFLVSARLQGPQGFYEFFRLDRPTTYYSYLVLMPILGTDPVRWQVFTLALRWLTAVLVWWTVGRLWPKANPLAGWTALIFAVHPIFRQQPIAMTYHQLWLEYAFYVLSIGAMAAAIRSQRRFWLWTILALAGMGLNFLISEYFLGVEFLRPVIIGGLLWPSMQNKPAVQKIRSVLKHWLPYLALLLIYLAWRFIFMDLPGEDRNAPELLTNLLANPFSGSVRLIQMALQDFVYIVAASWYETFQPGIIDFATRFNLAALGLTAFCTALSAVYLYFYNRQQEDEAGDLQSFRTAAVLGLLLVLVAPLPGWVTGRQVTVGAFSDRLATPAMLGASLLIAAAVAWLIRGRVQQIIIISLLIGLSVGQNLRVANDYRWARTQTNRLYWQLFWRAPALQPDTGVFSEGEILSKMGLYSTASGLNLVYADPSPSGRLPFWYFAISREFGHRMPELVAGIPLDKSFRQFTFQGDSRNSLVVYFETKGDCLRVLTPADGNDPALTPLMVQALPISNLSRIQSTALPGHQPTADIFGPEPERGWCYLFEKADLARQENDWQQVAALGDQAGEQGYSLQNLQSNTPQEWVPFIEGYAHTGRWEDAARLTQAVVEKEPKMAPRLCDVWGALQNTLGAAAEIDNTRSTLGCSPGG
jgi:hypothetical protein